MYVYYKELYYFLNFLINLIHICLTKDCYLYYICVYILYEISRSHNRNGRKSYFYIFNCRMHVLKNYLVFYKGLHVSEPLKRYSNLVHSKVNLHQGCSQSNLNIGFFKYTFLLLDLTKCCKFVSVLSIDCLCLDLSFVKLRNPLFGFRLIINNPKYSIIKY